MSSSFLAPDEFTEEELKQEYCLKFFRYEDLTEGEKTIAIEFYRTAKMVVTHCERNEQRTAALRKLLESRFWALRAIEL